MTFDELFMNVAFTVAQKSKDPSTKVGCVLVGPDNEPRSFGWNGLARGVDDLPERMERPTKYDWTVHGEANAIANAARVGIPTKGCRAYITHFPCKSCSDLLIQAGIECIVVGNGKVIGKDSGHDLSQIKLAEAGVKVWYMDKDYIE